MQSIKYTLEQKSKSKGKLVHDNTATFSIDFQNDNPHQLKYHLNSKEAQVLDPRLF